MSTSKFSIIILTIGIPSSGKSSWVAEYKKTHPLTYVVSTDEIRKEKHNGEYVCVPEESKAIHDEAVKRVQRILQDKDSLGGFGPEIIVDATNVDVDEWILYKKLNPTILIAKVFDISVEEAKNRQMSRSRKVPSSVIQSKWRLLQYSKRFMPFIFNIIN